MDRSIRCQSVERCRHLGMKTTGELVVAFLLAFTSACYSQTGYIPDQPSFDCSKASNAVAHILCSGPEAARANWAFNSAWWAFYFAIDEKRRPMLDIEQQACRQSLNQICALRRQLRKEEQAGQEMAQTMGRLIWGQAIRIPGPRPI